MLGIVALVPIAAFAVIVAIELRAWPFFTQNRIGKRGELFRMPKLRTLPVSTNPYAEKGSLRMEELPRISRFLRRSHIDELPQLLLVPLGLMSLVGPRPKMPDWVEPIEPEFAYARTRVRPGCTGLWQVGHDSVLRVADSPEFDYWYLNNRTIRLEAWILWRTLLLLAGLSGTVALDDVPRWAVAGGLKDLTSAATRATASVFRDEEPAEVASELT
jgi:lipopolysaccharide/colanic/teichoic acid biosynthesis glycosyltransferase